MSLRLRQRLATSTIAASALLVLAGLPARAQGLPAAKPDQTSPAFAARGSLKPLPAKPDDLLFKGESASRSWSVALTREEATRITTFQAGLLSAVSVLPDRSALRLTVNGRVLTTAPLGTGSKTTDLAVRVPAGLLVPGFNTVQVDVAQAHRVDCSVDATYELWSRLDPARTGFLVPAAVWGSVRGLDELAAEPSALDGTIRLHLRVPAEADAEALTRAGRFLFALVVKARLARPVVDVGPDAGTGPGLDVVIATAGAMDGLGLDRIKVLAREDDVVLGRDPSTNRLALIVSGPDESDLDSAVNRFVQAPAHALLGTAQAIQGLSQAAGARFDAAALRSLGSLGWQGATFSGRRYESGVQIELPGDFYPGNYGTARLYLDGSRSDALDPGSDLSVWVNGKLVSSLDLSRSPGQLDHEQVDLPLRFFRPGSNAIDIKAVTTTAADRHCDAGVAPASPRLTLANTSELEIPRIAHLETLMRLQRSLRFPADGGADETIEAYLPEHDRSSIGAALTLAANAARTSGRAGTVRFHLQAPEVGDAPGLVVASSDAVPPFLASRLPAVPVQASAEAPAAADTGNGIEAAAAANRAALDSATHRWMAAGLGWLRERGFFFAASQEATAFKPMQNPSVLVATVDPNAAAETVAGIPLPSFSRDGRQWLVVAADRTDLAEAGTARLTVDEHWPGLAGRAATLDLKTGQVQTIDDAQPTYVVPRRMALADIRPVLGGFVSNNIALSAAVLVVLLAAFGLSAHALLRSVGVKNR